MRLNRRMRNMGSLFRHQVFTSGLARRHPKRSSKLFSQRSAPTPRARERLDSSRQPETERDGTVADTRAFFRRNEPVRELGLVISHEHEPTRSLRTPRNPRGLRRYTSRPMTTPTKQPASPT